MGGDYEDDATFDISPDKYMANPSSPDLDQEFVAGPSVELEALSIQGEQYPIRIEQQASLANCPVHLFLNPSP